MKIQVINEINLSFLSKSVNEGFARQAVACFASQLDPNLEELNDIKTAVSEGVTNCIVHAYKDRLGIVKLRARIYSTHELEIRISDSGCGIEDIEKVRQPMYTTGGEDRSGMGFTIMESFMDGLKVSSKVGRGTVLTMRKKIIQRVGVHA